MKNRKGFTIVELVIVIAVIAILAAVLIPTFSGVIGNANQSAALQTARSTLTNALNMSSTASLAGTNAAGVNKTVIITEGYAFKYTGNELVATDFPGEGNTHKLTGSKAASAKDSDTTNNFNAILLAAENLVSTYTKTTDTELATGKKYYTKAANSDVYTAVETPAVGDIGNYYELTGSHIEKAIADYIVKASYITAETDGTINVTVVDGHYYVNYTDANTYVAEVFLNGDFSKKVAVFTTFG